MNWLIAVILLLCAVHYIKSAEHDDYYNKDKGLLFDAFSGSILSFPINAKDIQQQTTQVPGKMECVFACIGVPWCRSMNLKSTVQKNGLHVCELLSTDKHTHPNNMTQNRTYTHFSIKNPCSETPCLNDGTCIFQNNRQDYCCKCKKGFDGSDCQSDVNECTAGTHNCHTHATCTNTAGSFTCQCKPGYQGNGQTCSDVNECTTGTHNCHTYATCTNTAGSFTCNCKPGYQGNGLTCSDVNECTAGTHNCHTHATCTNTAGSFTCQCKPGYQGNGQTCSDVNECTTGTHNCHTYATCTNSAGSFTCQCNPGYQGNGVTCSDVNECTAGTHNCHTYATCTNSAGSFTCQCKPGYQGNGVTCSDVNECTAGTHNCHTHATCTNTAGSFTCNCKPGYQGNGVTCSALRRNCDDIHKLGERRNGVYNVQPASQAAFQVYCDMTANGGGWTLISRFSNNDIKNWMKDDGSWWYDVMTGQGSVTTTSVNQDMISPAFWSLPGREIKITRSDDPTHTALLRTTSNCLGSRTFRSMITSYGNFRNGAAWASNKCLRNCSVVYGGQYSTTDGFSQAKCSSSIQGSNGIGFWCQWSADGSVMMIGGGGNVCARADHGIGVTEEDAADFATTIVECDFGDILPQGSGSCPSSSYALNLWIR